MLQILSKIRFTFDIIAFFNNDAFLELIWHNVHHQNEAEGSRFWQTHDAITEVDRLSALSYAYIAQSPRTQRA